MFLLGYGVVLCCRQLGLEVRADNIAARRLSEKLGFHFANALADYYEGHRRTADDVAPGSLSVD